MFVVVPVKFDERVDVNVEGIHYRIHSIGIEYVLLKSLGGTLIKIPTMLKVVFLPPIF